MKSQTTALWAIVALLAVITISTLAANGAFEGPPQCVGPQGTFDCDTSRVSLWEQMNPGQTQPPFKAIPVPKYQPTPKLPITPLPTVVHTLPHPPVKDRVGHCHDALDGGYQTPLLKKGQYEVLVVDTKGQRCVESTGDAPALACAKGTKTTFVISDSIGKDNRVAPYYWACVTPKAIKAEARAYYNLHKNDEPLFPLYPERGGSEDDYCDGRDMYRASPGDEHDADNDGWACE